MRGGTLRLDRCCIVGGKTSIRCQQGSTVQLDACVLGHANCGIDIRDHSRLRGNRVEVTGCTRHGVTVQDHSVCVLNLSRVARHDGGGCMVRSASSMILKDTDVEHNRGVGVACDGQGSFLHLKHVQVASNHAGGLVLSDARVPNE